MSSYATLVLIEVLRPSLKRQIMHEVVFSGHVNVICERAESQPRNEIRLQVPTHPETATQPTMRGCVSGAAVT